LGEDATAFYGVGGDNLVQGSNETEEDHLENTLAQLVDQFASEYGWSLEYVVSRTYYQLTELSSQTAQRVFVCRKIAADTARMAPNAKRHEYERWLRSLNPDGLDSDTVGSAATGASEIPDGFVFKEEI
jgi:hypothetical protein